MGRAYLFPSPRNANRPISRDHARKLLLQAEAIAGVAKQARGAWHPIRRKWATERKDVATTDAMAAGGWNDRRCFEMCYQHVDPETLYRVVSQPKRLRGVVNE